MSATLPRCSGCASLETRVAQLEQRFYVGCEVCFTEGLHANCFYCCRWLCPEHLAEPKCPNHPEGRHTPRSRP
jgi:hypothetical protein